MGRPWGRKGCWIDIRGARVVRKGGRGSRKKKARCRIKTRGIRSMRQPVRVGNMGRGSGGGDNKEEQEQEV